MSTQTLSKLTLETLDNYRAAASKTVAAYRLGGHRLLEIVNGALENRVYPQTAKLAQRTTERMNEVRAGVSDVFIKGIDQIADRAEQAIQRSSTTAAAQLTKAAEFAAGIETPIVSQSLQTAARLSAPGAKVALALSSKVAEGAGALADAVGGRRPAKAVRKAVSGVGRKVAKHKVAAKTTAARVAKAAKTVRSPAPKRRRSAHPAAAAA